MKKQLWKRVLGITLASTMLFTTPAAYAIEGVAAAQGEESHQEAVLPESVSDNSVETPENSAPQETVAPKEEADAPAVPQETEKQETSIPRSEEQNQQADEVEAPAEEVQAETAKPIESDEYILIDDTVTEQNQENYFTYEGGIDNSANPDGEHGWVTSRKQTGNWSSEEVATEHWVWSQDINDVKDRTYTFTFKGTGVELIGIKSDAYMTVQLDNGEKQLFSIAGAPQTETLLYSVEGLDYAEHTVKVSMSEGKGGNGLQVSCAKVYGSKLPKPEITVIPYTKRDGEINRFKFSEKGWLPGAGNDVHCWSESPSKYGEGEIWYEVNFIGNKIDIYAGKNTPHGNVSYTIYEKGSSTPVQQPVTIDLRNDRNIDSVKVHTFSGLEENKVYTLKAVALGTGSGGQNIIDCSKVVVYHQPYQVDDFIPEAESYSLRRDQQQQITYTIKPSHATVSDMKFTSENPNVAEVDPITGLITAMSVGETIITLHSDIHSNVKDKKIQVKVDAAIPMMDGSIVDIDTQYTEDRYEEIRDMDKVKTQELTAWRNDKATSAIALISKESALKNVTVTASDMVQKDGNRVVSSKNIVPTFIKSTKAYIGPFLGYGLQHPDAPIPEDNGKNRAESSDILYQTDPINMGWNDVQPVWLEFNIPLDTRAGEYTSTITVSADGIDTPLTFEYTIHVQDTILPDATSFQDRFSIEFWHHPYASAEYYDVEPFSQEHLNALESSQHLYKQIGGNTIYTSIVEEPWKGQTWSKYPTSERPTYPSMVRWTKHKNGEFSFDYTHFDTWVQFNIDRGLGDKIVMFSVAPWHFSFKYYDEEGRLHTEPFRDLGGVGSERYNEIWTIFLKDLISHLETKGWFDRAYIGIDEQGFEKGAFDIVESVTNSKGQHLKIMGYMDGIDNPKKYELAMRCADYSIGDNAAQTTYPTEYKKLLKERNDQNLRTIFYSCTEHRPGNFSLSQPVESYFSVVNSGKNGATGFARWAYDAWVPDPLEDATHHSFEPGDCFVIYPDVKSNKDYPIAKNSVRLARMAEGVRDMNKVMLMLEEYPQLEPKVQELYEIIKTKARKNNYYGGETYFLSAEELSALREQMGAFKTGLNSVTEEYIRLGGKGDTTARGDILLDDGLSNDSGSHRPHRPNTSDKPDGKPEEKPENKPEEKPEERPQQPEVSKVEMLPMVAGKPDAIQGYSDMKEHWAKDAVAWAVTNQLFKGISETQFAPDSTMTRGMLATVLHRLAGQPNIGQNQFKDIPADAYYSKAIAWASELGLVTGVGNGMFEPNSNITREQLAVILYKFAGAPAVQNIDMSFADAAKVHDWAKDAVAWAVHNGLLSGMTDGTLVPNGQATRAQVATILMRFEQKNR